MIIFAEISAGYNAYTQEYLRRNQVELENGILMHNSLKYLCGKPEESIDMFGAAITMSAGVRSAVLISLSGNPAVSTAAIAVGGLAWAGYGVYRAIKGIMSDFLPEGG